MLMDISCYLCGVSLQALRTRAYPTESYPQARWDGGYDGKDVSKDDIEWTNRFRALRKTSGNSFPVGNNLVHEEDITETPFISGIGSFSWRNAVPQQHHPRGLSTPVNPAHHVDDPGYHTSPEDHFSMHSPYPVFGDEQGQGFPFHSRCWDIFRRTLPKRVRDSTTGERAWFVDSEVREKVWDILSSSDRLAGQHRGWEAGVGQYGFEGADCFQWSRYGGRRTAWANNRRGSGSHGGAKHGRKALAYFVADPIAIRHLDEVLNTPPRMGDVKYPMNTFQATTTKAGLPDIFAKLPPEILDMVLCMLPSSDVVNLRLAARSLAEEPLSNTFFRSRFRPPHELSYVWEVESIPRSASGKLDWRALYLAIKVLTKDVKNDQKEDDDGDEDSDSDTDYYWKSFCDRTLKSSLPIVYAKNPVAPGLANRLRITRLMSALANRVVLMIDTPVRGDNHTGRISMLSEELGKMPAEEPEDDNLEPRSISAEDFPDRCVGLHYLFIHRVEVVAPVGSIPAGTNVQHTMDIFDFYPIRGRSRIRIRKTISAGPQKIFGRDLEEQFISRPRSSSDAKCKEIGGRRCIWGRDKIVTKIGVSITGKADGTPKYDLKANGDCGDGQFICGLSFWGRDRERVVSQDGDTVMTDHIDTQPELLGEVGCVHPEMTFIEIPDGHILTGFMVGASEAGIRRVKALTNPPWYEARWIGSAPPFTIYKQEGFDYDVGDTRLPNKILTERRALGFEPCRGGPQIIAKLGEEWPTAEGRILAEDGWTVGGIVVGVGLLRLTSLALVEHRLSRYKGKGKGRATIVVEEENSVMVDGERISGQPLPLGTKHSIIPPEGTIDGLPSFVDRYLWLPHFPVPDYEELNTNRVSLSPENFMQAEKAFYHDALLSAGFPILPSPPTGMNAMNNSQYLFQPVGGPPPPPLTPLQAVKTKDEFSAMSFIDFGGEGGKDLKRLIGVNAWYGSRIVHARGVLALEFIYEMDGEIVKSLKELPSRGDIISLQKFPMEEERWIERKQWGNCWSGIRLGGAIDGPGGERIVSIGGESFDVYGRYYIGIWIITNFGRKLSFPACPTPAQPNRPRKRRKTHRRAFPTVQSAPANSGSSAHAAASWPSWSASNLFVPTPIPPPPPIPLPPLITLGSTPPPTTEENGSSDATMPPFEPIDMISTEEVSVENLAKLSEVTETDTGKALIGLVRTNTDSKDDKDLEKTLNNDAKDSQTVMDKDKTDLLDADRAASGTAAEAPISRLPPLDADTFADWATGLYSTPSPDHTKGSLGFRYFEPEDRESIITGFYSIPGGQGLRDFFEGFGVVTQKASSEEAEIFSLRPTQHPDLADLAEGCPRINFTAAEKDDYLQQNVDVNSFVRDFIGEVSLEDDIARVRVFYDMFHYNASSASYGLSGNGKITGLLFEYRADDMSQLVSDGHDGLRRKSAKILGEWRENEYAGTFELEPGEKIDLIWWWHTGRMARRQRATTESSLPPESLGNRESHAGKEMWGVGWPKGIRFRTTSGRKSRVFGSREEQRCKIFQSLPNKTMIGLKWAYETYDEWITPIFREHGCPLPWGALCAENIWPIPLSQIASFKNNACCQLLADPTDEEYSDANLRVIRGAFDVQFHGIQFEYKSGVTRRYGENSGVISEFKVMEGERVFTLKYRPGVRFALCLGLVRFDDEGKPHCRSTQLFGTDLPGFGLPPIEGDVADSLKKKTFYENEEASPLTSNDSSDYSDVDISDYDELLDDRQAYNKFVENKSGERVERGAGHYVGPVSSADGFVEIRVPAGMMFAGLWSRTAKKTHRLGMLVRQVTDADPAPFLTVDYDTLKLPSPKSPFLPVTDYSVDADDSNASVLTFNGRPYVEPLPWLGRSLGSCNPNDLVPDFKVSRKMGGQVGTARLWALIFGPLPIDIVCYYSFPTRMAHVHGLELLPAKGTSIRLGPPGFCGTLAKKRRISMKHGKAVGMRVGMAEGVYSRSPLGEDGKPRIAGWPIKVYRCKGGEPHIVTIELIFDTGRTVMLTPQARESTYKSKCPPKLKMETVVCEEGHEIVGFHGNFGLYCHAIGFISAPIKKNTSSNEPQSSSPTLSDIAEEDSPPMIII